MLAVMMQDSSSSDHRDLVPARVALMALRTGMHDREHTTAAAYMVVPDPARLDQFQAARALMVLPKPIMCIASNRDGVVIVECSPMLGAELQRLQQTEAEATIEDFEHGVSRLNTLRIDDPLVEVRGYQESLIVSFSLVKVFFRDYSLASYGVRLDPPDRIALAHGACAILLLGRGELRIEMPR